MNGLLIAISTLFKWKRYFSVMEKRHFHYTTLETIYLFSLFTFFLFLITCSTFTNSELMENVNKM